jgi:3-oxoacyl-[acyl-carrier protein] reductase
VNYGKSADKAKQVAGIEAKGGKAVEIEADMSKAADARRLVKDTIKQFGRLDILVNNAEMFLYSPLVETTKEEFDKSLPSIPRARILRCRKRRASFRKAAAS